MRILTITHPNMENGLGCRVTMWVAGCNHHCEGCHNQHTWNYDQGSFLKDKYVEDKILESVDKPYIKGLTISGGDPLAQSDESLKELCRFLDIYKERFPEKDIWIYTGSTYEDSMSDGLKSEVLKRCDIMVDGPFIKGCMKNDLAFRGSDNQRIIDLKKTAESGNIIQLEIQ